MLEAKRFAALQPQFACLRLRVDLTPRAQRAETAEPLGALGVLRPPRAPRETWTCEHPSSSSLRLIANDQSGSPLAAAGGLRAASCGSHAESAESRDRGAPGCLGVLRPPRAPRETWTCEHSRASSLRLIANDQCGSPLPAACGLRAASSRSHADSADPRPRSPWVPSAFSALRALRARPGHANTPEQPFAYTRGSLRDANSPD